MALHAYTYALGHYVTAKYWHLVEPDGLHFTISETGWGKAPKKDELPKTISGKIQRNKL